jgi:cytosine/adenosine deaminase-related metal-dependent hydrolase
MPSPSTFRLRIDADAAIDGSGRIQAPAAMLVEVAQTGEVLEGTPAGHVTLLSLDHPQRTDHDPRAAGAYRADYRGGILVPGLVNAHTHLDLTHVGPLPFDKAGGFTGFIKNVLQHRLSDPRAIRQAVGRGIELLLRGGTVAVGDIAGVANAKPCLTAFETLSETPLSGVSFLEFFAIGNAPFPLPLEGKDAQGLTNDPTLTHGVRLGLSPHAPYTVSRDAYTQAQAFAARHNLPLCTHLAETVEEREFIAKAAGPFRAFLEKAGWWNAAVAGPGGVGNDLSPIKHLLPHLEAAPYLLAHVNDCSSEDLRLLARTRCAVAYCPRASHYFHAPDHFGLHRYQDLQIANINVALGTDSVINLPPATIHAKTGRLSTLDEARFLYQRDQADPRLLLNMCTANGARALGLDPRPFRFNVTGDWGTSGGQEIAGIVAVPAPGTGDPFSRIMACDTAPDLLVLGQARVGEQ